MITEGQRTGGGGGKILPTVTFATVMPSRTREARFSRKPGPFSLGPNQLNQLHLRTNGRSGSLGNVVITWLAARLVLGLGCPS